jgi:hypothetical protein
LPLVLGVSFDARAQEDDVLVRWGEEVSELERKEMELGRRLDRVSSLIIHLDAPMVPLPDDLVRLPLFTKLELLFRSMETMRPKFKQIMRSTDIIDLNLLKDVNSEFRAVQEIVRSLR